MATIVLMVGGAILNATTFVAGSYLAKYLSGSNVDAERKRHDLALEKYESDYNAYQEKKQQFESWAYQQENNKDLGSQNFKTTDEALEYYNETHDDDIGEEPDFSDYYKPASDQKNAELLYVGGGMFGLTYLASKLF